MREKLIKKTGRIERLRVQVIPLSPGGRHQAHCSPHGSKHPTTHTGRPNPILPSHIRLLPSSQPMQQGVAIARCSPYSQTKSMQGRREGKPGSLASLRGRLAHHPCNNFSPAKCTPGVPEPAMAPYPRAPTMQCWGI